MKFTEQNYPLLRFLKWGRPLNEHPEIVRFALDVNKGKNTRAPFLEYLPEEYPGEYEQSMRHAIIKDWPALQAAFSSNIEILSLNFLKAFDRSFQAFIKPELFREVEGDFKGTLIHPDGGAICYDFHMSSPFLDPSGELCYRARGSAIRFHQDGNCIRTVVSGDEAYDSRQGRIERGSPEACLLFNYVIAYTLFKRFADITTVDAKSVRRHDAAAPEVKTTLRNIRFLDASWYTTIVRTEGFGVRGHFRLQPCGRDCAERKLVYIKEFRKKGYVRRARLLAEKDKGI